LEPGARDGLSQHRALQPFAAASAASSPRPAFADRLFPLIAERPAMLEVIADRFFDQRAAIISRAERAIAGSFDLLGYRELSFGSPIDWRLEPLSGKRTGLDHWSAVDYLNPDIAGDKKITWELNRHAHFVGFGQAYWLTGDERFVHAFVEQASAWMDANPRRRGINWASSLEVSFRAIAWLWALHLMTGASALTPRFVNRLLKCLIAHGRHVSSYLSHYFSPNTHLTGEALGLLYLGTSLPEISHSRRWRMKGLAILIDQLPVHIGPDGVYFEHSSCYHRYTIDFYLHALLLARTSRLQLPAEVDERLTAALDYLMWITRPDGTSPLIGDDDGGRLLKLGERPPNDFRDTLAAGAALFGRPAWKHVAGSAPLELVWLLGTEGLKKYDEIVAAPPAETARAFADSGYFVMRDGWDTHSSYAITDCGQHYGGGVAHAQSDVLSFEFAAKGSTSLVDPGTYTYTGDPGLREWFRSSRAHNTVSVDDQDQSISAGPFKWQEVANATAHDFISGVGLVYFEGSHDGYRRLSDPVTHARSILFVPGGPETSLSTYLVVRDSFDCEERHRYAARYQLAEGYTAATLRNSGVATSQRGEKLSVSVWSAGSTGSPDLRVAGGWVSKAYGQRVAAPAIIAESEARGRHQLLTLLIPETTTGGLAAVAQAHGIYSISTSDSFDLIACPRRSEARSGLMSAVCELAWARFIRGRLARGCAVRATDLEIAGGIAIHSPAIVPWLAFDIADGVLNIVSRGASRLDLTLGDSSREIRINGTPFAVNAGTARLRLELCETGWRLSTRN
jgi:hypothetical protein